jgi:hypothetical protein
MIFPVTSEPFLANLLTSATTHWGAWMDLGGWLRNLDLERYETAFRENEIDETVLPSLTHETLKELGVAARRLLVTLRPRPVPRASLPRIEPSAAKSQ